MRRRHGSGSTAIDSGVSAPPVQWGQSFTLSITHSEIKLDPTTAKHAFTFTPPPDAQPMAATGVTRVLAVGTESPEFSAKDMDGTSVNPLCPKGKPVLVTSWFYG